MSENRKYEAVIVLNIQGKDEGVESMITGIGNEIEAEGAKLDSIDKLGVKDFAYDARNIDTGYYVNFQFHAPADTVSKLQAKFSLNKDIYMQYYQAA